MWLNGLWSLEIITLILDLNKNVLIWVYSIKRTEIHEINFYLFKFFEFASLVEKLKFAFSLNRILSIAFSINTTK